MDINVYRVIFKKGKYIISKRWLKIFWIKVASFKNKRRCYENLRRILKNK